MRSAVRRGKLLLIAPSIVIDAQSERCPVCLERADGAPHSKGWFRELRVGIDDLDAVLRDQLRKKRDRDLGPREARRLYRDARDKLRSLLAYAGGGGDDGDGGDVDESGRDPAGSGGSPAH